MAFIGLSYTMDCNMTLLPEPPVLTFKTSDIWYVFYLYSLAPEIILIYIYFLVTVTSDTMMLVHIGLGLVLFVGSGVETN